MIINSQIHDNEIVKGLYIVSTPIGNLEDITLRALNILNKSDYILCEDTRLSKILLEKYSIKSKLISNHKFNEKKNLTKIIKNLRNGQIISLISDAGTPGISDPGAVLVNACIENKIKIIPSPGPSSVISAMSVSGFSEKFFFYGFFPEKKQNLEKDLIKLSQLESSLVFFVSPKKIQKIVPYIKKNFSGRKILICREMTKYFEELIRTDVDKLEELNIKDKGEMTIVISEKKINNKTSQTLSESDKKMIIKMINKLSVKEIISLINRNQSLSKKEIYKFCIKLKNEK